tara:strand:+ start:74 stop:280 length:207 start_codon:yes stop_codon:yes gene_type:complete
MTLKIGFNETNLMIGGNVTSNVTKMNIVNNLLDKIGELLNAKVHRQDVIDSTGNASKRIIITYKEENG